MRRKLSGRCPTLSPVSKMSRDKGKRGELEVVNLAKAAGFSARRTAPLQTFRAHAAADVRIDEFDHLHIEVKRNEQMSVDAMCRQAESEAPEGHTPVVAWRRNNGPWRVAISLSEWLLLLNIVRDAERVISG